MSLSTDADVAPTQTTGAAADWLKPGAFAALLGLLVIAAFPQVVFALQTFVYRDFGYYSYPIAFHFRESFWQGEMPLWNPYNNCGMPFLAQWNSQVLYPPALFYLLFPLSWSLGVFCLLHLFLGGLGMYFLAHRWTGHQLAAAVAGVAFAFNGLMLNSVVWPGTIPGFGWMPWVVWLTERAWREGGRSVITAAIVGAMQMLSGAAEVILMTWALLGALGLVEFIRGETPRGRMLLRCAVVVLLVSGLCAAQLLPFFDFLHHSNRQKAFRATDWPMPLTGWGNLLVPLFHSHRSYHGVFFQTGQYWTPSYYVGATTIALAMAALWRARQWRVWLLAALVLFCLVMAFGDATPLYRWLSRYVGVLNLMRFPVKFVILPVFALPLLAAFALAAIQGGARAERASFGRRWWVLWLIVISLLSGVIGLGYKYPLPYDNWTALWQNGAARAVFFTAIIGVLFLAERMTEVKMRRLLQLSLLLLLWLDLYRHAPSSQTVNRVVYEPGVPPRSLLAPRHGSSRAMLSGTAREYLSHSFMSDVAEDYVSRRFTLFSDCNLLDSIPKVDAFFPLQLRAYMGIAWLLYDYTNGPSPGLLDFTGVSMVTSPTNVFDWSPRSTALPMVTGGQKPAFADYVNTVTNLMQADFNPRAEVLLPLEARGVVTVTNLTPMKLSPRRISAHHLELEVEASGRGMVVVAQTYYHPWRAYVDGRATRLWQANLAFQALEVPAGRHTVTLVYRDLKFYLGAAVSLATLSGCLFVLLRRRRKPTLRAGLEATSNSEPVQK